MINAFNSFNSSIRLYVLAASFASSAVIVQAAETGKRQLEEVVVTATKRSENLRDIPASIAHFDGSVLEEQGKLNLADYLQETPGVVVNSAAPGVMRISIRGIGVDNSPDATIPSAVGILIGDTSFTDPYIGSITPDLSAFDLASVEVLKGPQGTVFGGAALSGAVRYVLESPHTEGLEFKAFSQYSDVDHGGDALTSGVAANIPLYEDKLALRVGFVSREYPGLYDNRRSGENDVNDGGGDQVRAIVRWLPTDKLDIKLTYLEQDFSVDDGVYIADNREERSLDDFLLKQPREHDFSLTSLDMRYDFDRFSVMSLTSLTTKNSYAFSDISATFFSPPPGAPEATGIFSATNHNSEAVAQEIRFQSNGDWWVDWIAGVYSYDYELHFDIYINTIAQDRLLGGIGDITSLIPITIPNLTRETSLLFAFNDATATEEAIFLDFTKTFWDRLHLAIGARYYETVVEGGYDGVGVLARAANNGQAVDIFKEIVESGVSPRYSIKFDISDDISVYTQAAKGFRFGGIQTIPASEADGVPETYKSDKLWNYEIGLRSSWLDNTLQFDAAIFKIDYQDPQIQQKTQTSNLGFKDNVGSAESTGYEVSLRWLTPIDGLALSLDGGEVDSHTSEAFVDSAGNMIPAGTQMPGAADSQYSATASYFNSAFDVNYNLYLTYSYIGKNFGDLAQTEAVNDFATLNAGVSLTLENLSFRPQFSLNVTNIRDEIEPIGGGSRDLPTGERQAIYIFNSPRTVNARLSVEF
ncbi:TonB-dependent receptor [Zhongshania aquimaris]|uniref:TonB-dependent receptor n=1 Tax=Zhongshania aquimaris TaxID=2857107 RepID=A0ABS6VW12_9GAMM|nr:TonB-dependent receptor [Zhongshania aquimaris]MBW2942542.1 TonB-dependent receptor [Zhongshania aquimaris]